MLFWVQQHKGSFKIKDPPLSQKACNFNNHVCLSASPYSLLLLKLFLFENYITFFHDCNYATTKEGVFKSFVYKTVISLSALKSFIIQ
jgi:hypothetical protein